MAKQQNRMPNTLVLIMGLALLVWVLTVFIPIGTYQSHEVTYQHAGEVKTKTVLDSDSFQYVLDKTGEPVNQALPVFAEPGGHGLLNAAFDGLTRGDRTSGAVAIIAFLLIIGGSFGVMMAPSSIHKSLLKLLQVFGQRGIWVVPTLCLVFSLGGAVFGMSEEAIAFALVLAPIFKKQGFDAVTVVLTTYVATQVGFASSWMNPFNVAIAQGLAEVPMLSGAGFRFSMWLVFTVCLCVFSFHHAKKTKTEPAADVEWQDQQPLSWGDRLMLLNLLLGLIWVVWGVSTQGYYIPEIASQFFAMGLVAAIITLLFRLDGLSANQLAEKFQQGAADLLPAALVVGFAQGIIVIMGGANPTDPSVLNTLLHHTGQAIGALGESMAALMMFVFQSGFNFFVSSGSGQAALTMPLMAPLADLVGVTRQTAVLAFQLGDGLTNLLVPTSASLMGCLGVVKVHWSDWLKFIWKFLLFNMILAMAWIVTAVATGF